MPTPPDFTNGTALEASSLNSVGLWLVKTQTVGAGVSSVTVTGAFSADYDSYKITYTGGVGSASNHLTLQLGATTTGYNGGLVFNNVSSATPSGATDVNASVFTYAGGGNANHELLNLDLHNPFTAKRTLINAWNLSFENFGMYNGFLANTTSYTAFTLSVSGATITGGTIRVYGYRN